MDLLAQDQARACPKRTRSPDPTRRKRAKTPKPEEGIPAVDRLQSKARAGRGAAKNSPVPDSLVPTRRPTEKKRPALFGTSTATRPTKRRIANKHANLEKYDLKFHGRPLHSDKTGEFRDLISPRPLSAGTSRYTPSSGSIYASNAYDPAWKQTLPHPAALAKGPFGRPDKNRAWKTESCFDTTVFLFLKYGTSYLSDESLMNLLRAHPLIEHLHTMISALATYDFRWLRKIDTNWSSQTSISPRKIRAMTAALFHYNFSVANLMRWLGNNYTGAHRDIQYIVQRIRPHVDPDLVSRLI